MIKIHNISSTSVWYPTGKKNFKLTYRMDPYEDIESARECFCTPAVHILVLQSQLLHELFK